MATLWPIATRQPGEYTSPAQTIPEASDFRIFLTGLDLTAQPSTTQLAWAIELSRDSGQTWTVMTSGELRGGMVLVKPQFYIAVNINGLAGYLARGKLSLNTRLRMGIDLEII